MTIDEALSRFKATETKETAALVVEDKDLQRILACWPHVPRAVVESPLENPGNWAALWDGVGVDEPALADLSGLTAGRALVAYRRARALRLIYPDGTVHSVARVVLQAVIRAAVPAAAKPRGT